MRVLDAGARVLKPGSIENPYEGDPEVFDLKKPSS
jgi:hypothetical protein